MTAATRSDGQGWVISRSQDLIWLHGSVLAGLVLLAVFASLPGLDRANYSVTNPAIWVLLAWGVLFDGTHVMATYARTYAAPDAASKQGLPGHGSFAWLLVGPAIAVVDQMLFPQHASIVGNAGDLFGAFLAVAYVWAYYHLIRQHYGFLSLYRRKAGLASSLTAPDAMLLWVGTVYPFVRFDLSDAYARSGLPVLLPAASLPMLRVALDVAFALAVLAIAVRWLRSPSVERRGSAPRILFLAIVIGFSNLVFAVLDNLLAITAVLTIFHNLQYHRIVWLYERGHGRVPMRSAWIFLAAGIALGIAWYGPRVLGVAGAGSDLLRNVLVGVGWGFAFHHYHLDARIWRVRRQPALGQALDRAAAPGIPSGPEPAR